MKKNFIDMHCDTLLKSIFDKKLYENSDNMLDVSRMISAGQGAQFFAVFFPPPEDFEISSDDELFDKAKEILQLTASSHSDVFRIAYSADDVRENIKHNIVSGILTIEDARFVNSDLSKMQKLYSDGVRAMSLTWNSPNCLGYPNSDDKETMQRGLTGFGREAVSEMNRLGMIIDVSHLSDGGFWDVAEISTKPFAATHSNCRQLCNHKRNLTDDMIKAISESGGVIGVNFAPEFLSEDGRKISRCDDIVSHVLHIISIGGEDCAGLGSDFDGISGVFEISEPGDIGKIFAALSKSGISPRVIDKLAFGNVLRLLGDTLHI